MGMMRNLPDATTALAHVPEDLPMLTLDGEPSMDRRIATILEFIRSSPIDAVSLESAAAIVWISPSRLRHLFKEHVGISFHKYVINVRLERARYLLRTTNCTVEQIAAMLGIQDRSHFAHIFKRAYGVSPGAARGGRAKPNDQAGEEKTQLPS